MHPRRHPAVAPALAVLLGTATAPSFSSLPIGGLALLVCLGMALGRRWSRLLAAAALGTLNAALFWVVPARQAPVWETSRPIAARLELGAPWQRGSFGWWTYAAVVQLRQGTLIGRGPARAVVTLPEGDRPPEPGPLRARGYLKRATGYANFGVEPRPGLPRLAVKSRRLLAQTAAQRSASPGLELGWKLRRWLDRRLERSTAAMSPEPVPSPGEGLLRALALGDRSRLPTPLVAGLRRFGLSHLLAVSGLHVGILVAPILLAGRQFPAAVGTIAAVAGLGLYLILVGPRPSLLRAALMVLLLIAAQRCARPPQLLNSLAVVAAGVVVVRPEIVDDLGFKLTVAATAGILVLGRSWSERWQRLPYLPRPLVRGLSMSLGAQVAALPWSLPSFHMASPVSPLLNLVAVPWTGLCLQLSLLTLLLIAVHPELGSWAMMLLDLMSAPFSWPGKLHPFGWETVLVRVDFFAATMVAMGIVLILNRPRRLALAALLLILIAAWHAGERRAPQVVMLDVGQGDALLLVSDRAAILIDGGGFRGGGDFAASVLIPALRAAGVTALDAMVMTHPDRDHCGGLVDLSRYLRVAELWVAAGPLGNRCGEELAALHRGRRRELAAGDRLSVGDWRFEVLHPPDGGGGRAGPRNTHSLVLRAATGRFRLLLTGDIDATAERRMMSGGNPALSSRVLKLAHHGSRSSTSEPFLARTEPRLAMISAGAGNPYGHPSPAVLARLDRHRVRVLRTDRHGAVRLGIEPGGRLRIETRGRE